MKKIVKPDGTVYCYISLEDGQLLIKLNQGKHKGLGINLDAKIIPQLRQLLNEAEFFKYL